MLFAPLIVYLILAVIDRKLLRDNDHHTVAFPGWAVIPPLYLVVRWLRVGALGVLPLITWVLMQSLVVAALLTQLPGVFALAATEGPAASPSAVVDAPISADQRAYELTPAGMAAQITTFFAADHKSLDKVVCPPAASTEDGSQVTCAAQLASVNIALVVLIDSTNPTSAFTIINQSVQQ